MLIVHLICFQTDHKSTTAANGCQFNFQHGDPVITVETALKPLERKNTTYTYEGRKSNECPRKSPFLMNIVQMGLNKSLKKK